jgi:DNA invertase Pin-like site-specific DNA recombinase
LELALRLLEEGDTLVVVRLDRLGRSMRDLANIAHDIQRQGAALKMLEQHVDTSTPAGNAFFGMLAVFAQFETDLRRELAAGRKPSEIARSLGVSRMTIWRAAKG